MKVEPGSDLDYRENECHERDTAMQAWCSKNRTNRLGENDSEQRKHYRIYQAEYDQHVGRQMVWLNSHWTAMSASGTHLGD